MMKRERLLFWGALAALLAGGWWLRSPLHHIPFERDEAAYVLIAQGWRGGAVLYRDLFDHKPPLLFLVYTLALALPGDLVGAVRVLATLYLLATGVALAGLALRLYGRSAALAALATLLVYSSTPRLQGPMFNSEAALVLPATLGCLLAVWAMQTGRLAGYALAGLAVGVAAGIKPVGLALLGPLALAPLLAPGPPARRAAGLALGLLGSLLAPLGLGLLLWGQGALPAAYEALVVYNRLYVAESLRGWTPDSAARTAAPLLWLGLAALLGWGAGLRAPAAGPGQEVRPAYRAAHTVAGLWGLALLAGAPLSLRAYPHYYLAAVPLLSLWAGAAAALAARACGRTLAAPVGLALLAALLAEPLGALQPLRAMAPAQQIAALYGPDGDQFFAPAAKLGDLIAAHAPPGRPIFVWAAEPQLYLSSGRRPATRFVYDYPLDRLPGARDEVLALLARDPPPVIVTYRGVRPIGFHPFMDDHGYRLLDTTYGYDLFVRSKK
jgi:hypothetical protein